MNSDVADYLAPFVAILGFGYAALRAWLKSPRSKRPPKHEHIWSPWEVVKRVNNWSSVVNGKGQGNLYSTVIIQQRTCLDCGYTTHERKEIYY